MQPAKVIGSITATVKHSSMQGAKMLLVQPQLVQGQADGDPIIDDYLTLYTSVRARTDSSDHAWGSVCQAMFTHPDFFMY